MEFKKVKELLDKGLISSEVATELNAEFITVTSKLREEAKSWREKYQTLNGTFEDVKSAKEELESKLTDIEAQILKAKEEGKAELVSELETYKKQQEEIKSSLEKIESENKRLKIENELTSHLTNLNPVDVEAVKTLLSLNADLTDTGVVINIGGEALPLKDGLEKFRELKPALFKGVGVDGTQYENNPSGGTTKKRSEMSPEEKASYINKHGSEAYLKLPE